MRRSGALALVVVLIAGDALAQAIPGQGPIQQPPTPPPSQPRSNGGSFPGISLTFKLGGKKKPPVPPVPSYEAQDVDMPDELPDEVIFVTAPGVNAARIAKLGKVTIIEATPLEAIGKTMVVAKLTPPDTVAAATARLSKLNGVDYAQPNHLFQSLGKAAKLPPRFSLHGITPAMPPLVSGRIAIIDTPVDFGHVALKGARIEQLYFSPATKGDLHGTAVASLLVGGGEAQGIANGASLLSLSAFDPADKTNRSLTSRIVKAMNAAWQRKPDVLNLSFGGKEDRLMGEMLAAIDARGICMAAAVGNGGAKGRILFPATHPATLGVTAVDFKLNHYAYASTGSGIDVAGVGVSLFAPVPGGYRNVSGTSFATAIVSGLLLRDPNCTQSHNPAAMRAAAVHNTQDLGAKGPDPIFGAGLFRLRGGK